MRHRLIATAALAAALCPAAPAGAFTGSATNAGNAARAAAVFAPRNATPPSIAGTARAGETLAASPGTWERQPETYAYAWLRCRDDRCEAAGAGTTYRVTSDDVGARLVVEVTAGNAAGAATARSPVTEPVTVPPPVNTTAPAISGTARVGHTLTLGDGAWSGTPTAYAYRWQRCPPASPCTDIAGATWSTYQPVAADVGAGLRGHVTATNAGGDGTATSASTPAVAPALALPLNVATNGVVRSIVRTPDGGWLFAGEFTTVNGATRNRVARLDAGGQLTAFHPNVTGGSVQSIALLGDRLYLGGDFTAVGGQPRAALAAVDASSGAVLAWNAALTGPTCQLMRIAPYVSALEPGDGVLYVGGRFVAVNGTARGSLAALDAGGGLTGWAPSATPSSCGGIVVRRLAVSAQNIWLSGNFDRLNGQVRNGFAALTAAGALQPAAPVVGADHLAPGPAAGVVIAGAGGARSIRADGTTAWNVSVDALGVAVDTAGATAYLAGDFTEVHGIPRSRTAAVPLATGSPLTAWNPGVTGYPSVVQASADAVAVGTATSLRLLPP